MTVGQGSIEAISNMSTTSITANAIKAVFPYQTLHLTKELTNYVIL